MDEFISQYVKDLQKINYNSELTKYKADISIKINQPVKILIDRDINSLLRYGIRVPTWQIMYKRLIDNHNDTQTDAKFLKAENERLRKEVARLKDQLVMADSRNIMLMRDNRILVTSSRK